MVHIPKSIPLSAIVFCLLPGTALATTRPLPDLSGTWARAQVTAALVDVPIVGELSSRTLAVTLLRVTQNGEDPRSQ